MTKKLLSLSIITFPLQPAIVISCNTQEVKIGQMFRTLKTNSFPNSFKQLENGEITVTGAWEDARIFLSKDLKSKVEVVGVQKKRISNDGIQAKPSFKAGDIKVTQFLFKELIKKAKEQKQTAQEKFNQLDEYKRKSNDSKKLFFENYQGEKDLLMIRQGRIATLFDIYSHTNYKALNKEDKIGLFEEEDFFEKQPISDNVDLSSDTLNELEFFTKANPQVLEDVKTVEGKTLKINFVLSNEPNLVNKASSKMEAFLKSKGIKTKFEVKSDYKIAAKSLNNNQVELAFLPLYTWAKEAPESNFILQASRPVQIATVDLSEDEAKLPGTNLKSQAKALELFNKYGSLYLKNVTTAKLEENEQRTAPYKIKAKSAFKKEADKGNNDESKIRDLADSIIIFEQFQSREYEAWIYTMNDSKFYKKVKEVSKERPEQWKIKVEDIYDDIVYGYTDQNSSASFVYPNIWFKDHFEKN